ncbi:helix-turn-helix domain-containing protein [Candidatus Soleaferrea massiliensis]|uniref:helix-turn-helix domain-containing protein n=1 Tax=Candidatus Soleaferrea massiliensis TaxID=1470354 RepID=UPI0018CF5AEC|nr:helix-turn-helix domain-containing protein [Candidatus Soleaferrea massiliensis]
MDDILSFQPQCRFMLYTTQIYDEALIDTMILGGFRYLIKDPRLDNMNNVLHAVDLLAQLIIKNMKREEQDQQIRSQLKQLSQTAKRFCCNLLITGGVPEDADQAKSLLKQFGLPMSAPAYSLSVYLFAPDDNPAFDDREGLMYRFLELLLENSEAVSLFMTLNHEVCLLFTHTDYPSGEMQQLLCERAKKYNRQYWERYGCQPYSGFSQPVASFQDFPKAFRIAQSVARFAMLHGRSSVAFSELQIEEKEYCIFWTCIDYTINCLQAGQPFASAVEYMMYMLSQINASVDFAQMLAIDFLIALQRSFPEVFEHWFCYREDILQIKDLNSFSLFLNKQLVLFRSSHDASSELQYKCIIQQAQLYIQEHYAEKLTLAVVAKQIPISSSYLSSLFQKKSEMGFKEYLLLCRIDRAKDLLESTQDKISNIAKQTGFANVKYFSTCFKQKTGYTPSVYRNLYRKESKPQKVSMPME